MDGCMHLSCLSGECEWANETNNAIKLLQELINNYRDCKNQLCLNCSLYKQEHFNKKEDSEDK